MRLRPCRERSCSTAGTHSQRGTRTPASGSKTEVYGSGPPCGGETCWESVWTGWSQATVRPLGRSRRDTECHWAWSPRKATPHWKSAHRKYGRKPLLPRWPCRVPSTLSLYWQSLTLSQLAKEKCLQSPDPTSQSRAKKNRFGDERQ